MASSEQIIEVHKYMLEDREYDFATVNLQKIPRCDTK